MIERNGNLETQVLLTLEGLQSQCRSFQSRIARSDYAYFLEGEAYVRVGPRRFHEDHVELAVTIARVHIEEQYRSQGAFVRICRVAYGFAKDYGYGFIHECVGEPRLQDRHLRDGFAVAGDGGLPSYLFTPRQVEVYDLYRAPTE